MQEEFFYNSSIKNYITAFGNVFNNVKVKHGNGNTAKVPIKFGAKEKFIEQLFSTLEDTPAIEKVLPVISYELTSLTYDPSRKTNTLHKNIQPSGSKYKEQLNPVPYNFGFTLSIFTRYGDELFQIVEQILPFFQPSFNITIKENVDMGIDERDVPIILNSTTWTPEYIGEKGIRRRLEGEMTFTLKGWLYPDIKDNTDVIKRVLIDFGLTPAEQFFETVEFIVDPWSSKPTDDYSVLERPGFYEPMSKKGYLNHAVWDSQEEVVPRLIVHNGKLTKSVQNDVAGAIAQRSIIGRDMYSEFKLIRPAAAANGILLNIIRLNRDNYGGYWFWLEEDGSGKLMFVNGFYLGTSHEYITWPANTFKNNDILRIEVSGEPDVSPQTGSLKIFKNNVLLTSQVIYNSSPDLAEQYDNELYNSIAYAIGGNDTLDNALGFGWIRVGYL